MSFDIKQLRKEAAARAVKLEIDRLAAEHDAIITAAIREDNRRTGTRIDSAMARSKIITERATTAQTKFDRQSLFDAAEHNPVLARLLCECQRKGVRVG